MGSFLLSAVALGYGLWAGVRRPRAFTGTSSDTRLQDRHNSATVLQFPNHSHSGSHPTELSTSTESCGQEACMRPQLASITPPNGSGQPSHARLLPDGNSPRLSALQLGAFWGFSGFPGKEPGWRDRTVRAKEEGK